MIPELGHYALALALALALIQSVVPAIGARKRDIRRQFLLEAALLSSSGGVVGLVVGAAAAGAVRGMLGFPAQTTATIAAGAIALSAAVGLLAGYWPARSASNLPVVDALRDET